MNDLKVFLLALFIRICSVWLVQTSYVPDEYWQTLEVAHALVFGYGYYTWEWLLGIRSYIPPLIVAFFYKIFQLLSIDCAVLLVYFPRVLQAVLTAYSDLCFYQWSGRKKWALFSILSAWFWFYTGSRTLPNTFETALTIIALNKFTWTGTAKGCNKTFISIVALMCVIRPTAAIQWLPLCLYNLFIMRENIKATVLQYTSIGFGFVAISILIDSLVHGSLIVTSYEFLKFNLIDGVNTFYGTNPWYWYLSSGLPAVLGIHLLPFVLATLYVLKNREICRDELVLLGSIVFTVSIYSFIPHKEFRFILPLLPIALHISSAYLARWSNKAKIMYVWTVAGVLLFGNSVPAWYFSTVHQRGTLDVMPILRNISLEGPKSTHLLFLMPCHSTPLYSHLHVNVTARFLTCQPNFEKKEKYLDEADEFYLNPNVWLRKHYPPNGTLPSHIITFDSLIVQLTDILTRYEPTHRIFHANEIQSERTGKYMVVHKRIGYTPS